MDGVRKKKSAVTHFYRRFTRPLIFSYDDPEDAHELVGKFLHFKMLSTPFSNYFDVEKNKLSFSLGGKVQLDGPIGLAAGLDKNAEMLNGLSNIFDYVTFGTALPYEWAGNPKSVESRPHARRIVRLVEQESMLNCLGFPFGGMSNLVKNLKKYDSSIPLNASVAVRPDDSKDQEEPLRQFESMLDMLVPFFGTKIKMIEANFASPNTKGLSIFFEKEIFDVVAKPLIKLAHESGTLVFLKMPPHTVDETRKRNLRVAKRWIQLGGDGITMINTVRTPDNRLTMEAGGLSGRAIYDIMLSNLKDYRKELGDGPIINACGGVTADKVAEVLIDGKADTVQVLTPFIYEGPGLIRDAKLALLEAMKEKGFEDINALREHNFGKARKGA